MSELPFLLKKANKISEEQALQAISATETRQIEAYSALLEISDLTSKQLTAAISELYALPILSLDDFDYRTCCEQLGIGDLIRSHTALPLEVERQHLTLALADPSISEIEQEFRFATGLAIKLVLAELPTLARAINNLYGAQSASDSLGYKEVSALDLEQLVEAEEHELIENEELNQDSSPISRYIQQILLDAVRKRASDIHFEPYDACFRVRFRCDGLLVEVQRPPQHLCQRLTARLKILAKLDIAERRLPQDGRITLHVTPTDSIDIRVSTLPTIWGEKVVLRLLDNRMTSFDLDSLGYNRVQSESYRQALTKPQGLILITGPTGSGKTLSLYSGLNIINQNEVNIATAEDPVEIHLTGINQVQIQPQIGFNFAQALRAFLRQDPDVVMVGEIRDRETAEIATKAAQTGHLVLSTLHTNSAAEAILRLQNMGIETFNLAASLSLIIAQRLVRCLCPQCKRPTKNQTGHYEASSEGCQDCNQGYSGRTGIYEVLTVTPEIAQAVNEGSTALQIEDLAIQQGMQTLQHAGLEKLAQGITSQAELQRVLI
ncbi:type IV-A pilus assembly ATPase PilB [Vibrio coralliilyticus]|uniref:General secretion pathway protein GspE n=1 Tax=Vibrio coralliilyticus TaxID=190893 RepID=A0AAN0VY95_9VIBR|nr:type IV-A pilus assembly ATPase PilB [Vibrio coralliilyticus]AIW19898.1 general secretion pathway protein GspE [Vibrio coralliilyticus]NOH40623.1 type IV-A pilus assembly ATPase PilB [Vibrio coralliilyticus]